LKRKNDTKVDNKRPISAGIDLFALKGKEEEMESEEKATPLKKKGLRVYYDL
jgi:hypothetical protein